MTALRHAARTLAGRRPHTVAVGELQGRLLPRRLIHGAAQPDIGETENTPAWLHGKIKEYYETQIREKREDLYNRLHEMRSCETYWDECLRQPEQHEVSALLEHTSKVVEAKPSDKTWRRYRLLKRLDDWARRSTTFGLCFLAPCAGMITLYSLAHSSS